MKTKSARYLNYVEDTKKQHAVLNKSAKRSVTNAISNSYSKSVPITYLDGDKIVELDKKGEKVIVGSVENNRRKVEVGATTKLSER